MKIECVFCFSVAWWGGDEEFGFRDTENSPHIAAGLCAPLFEHDFATAGGGNGVGVHRVGVDAKDNPVVVRDDDVEYSTSVCVPVGVVEGSEDAVPVPGPGLVGGRGGGVPGAVLVDDRDGDVQGAVAVLDHDLVDDSGDPGEAAQDSVPVLHSCPLDAR